MRSTTPPSAAPEKRAASKVAEPSATKPAARNPARESTKAPASAAARPAARSVPKPAAPAEAKPVAKEARKSPARAPAKAPVARVDAAAVPQTAADKPVKAAKVRLVRDSFTMPESDFELVSVLKARALKQGRAAKKSELLRAGLQLLNEQTPQALQAALDRLQPIKTGRPKRAD